MSVVNMPKKCFPEMKHGQIQVAKEADDVLKNYQDHLKSLDADKVEKSNAVATDLEAEEKADVKKAELKKE